MVDFKQSDREILFFREVKAGKRIYYIDVKRDRNGDHYISLTESKRIKAGTEGEKPVFEKHKVFFYVDDLEKLSKAMDDVRNYLRNEVPTEKPSKLLEDFSFDL
ncbi:MAG: DUF3276 family protein [Alloprevotella sp.]|nr:DUF3276 family protein [Alloprevotella sp.]